MEICIRWYAIPSTYYAFSSHSSGDFKCVSSIKSSLNPMFFIVNTVMQFLQTTLTSTACTCPNDLELNVPPQWQRVSFWKYIIYAKFTECCIQHYFPFKKNKKKIHKHISCNVRDWCTHPSFAFCSRIIFKTVRNKQEWLARIALVFSAEGIKVTVTANDSVLF